MTIFKNSNMPYDIELHMASFLPHQDRVVLSGVNRNAYRMLSNDNYFYNLFLEKYCSFEQGEKRLVNQLDRLCNNYPSNCWKVACCVFQGSAMNFSQAFINEALPKEMDRLIVEKNACESRIKEICGDFYEDPSSPIHQAWQAFEKQKCIFLGYQNQIKHFGSLCSQIIVDSGKMDEWLIFQQTFTIANMNAPSHSREERLSAAEKIDKRLRPIGIFFEDFQEAENEKDRLYGKYQQLEAERMQNDNSIKNLDICLNVLKTEGYSPLKEKRELFSHALNRHLENLIASPQSTSDDIYHAFKVGANIECPNRILTALAQRVHANPAIMSMFQTHGENIFCDAIEQYASESIEVLKINFNEYTAELCSFFAKIPKETVENILLEAIEKKHGVKLNQIVN